MLLEEVSAQRELIAAAPPPTAVPQEQAPVAVPPDDDAIVEEVVPEPFAEPAAEPVADSALADLNAELNAELENLRGELAAAGEALGEMRMHIASKEEECAALLARAVEAERCLGSLRRQVGRSDGQASPAGSGSGRESRGPSSPPKAHVAALRAELEQKTAQATLTPDPTRPDCMHGAPA